MVLLYTKITASIKYEIPLKSKMLWKTWIIQFSTFRKFFSNVLDNRNDPKSGREPNLTNSTTWLNRYRTGFETCPQANTSKSGHAIFSFFFRRVRATIMTQRRVKNTRVHFWTFSRVSVKIRGKKIGNSLLSTSDYIKKNFKTSVFSQSFQRLRKSSSFL